MSGAGDPRRVLAEIRAALEAQPREALVELLGYVFKEYVVEGRSPLPSGAGAILDARSELQGRSFAEVITWLQAHLDLPELAAFEVEGQTVSLRVGGRMLPIVAVSPAPAPPPAPETGTTTGTTTTRPAERVAPTETGAPTPTGTGTPAGTATATAAGSKPAAETEELSEPSSRFSLLEVD